MDDCSSVHKMVSVIHCRIPFVLYASALLLSCGAGLASFYSALAPLASIGLVPSFLTIINQSSVGRTLKIAFLSGCGYLAPLLVPLVRLEAWDWSQTQFLLPGGPLFVWATLLLSALLLFGGVFFALYALTLRTLCKHRITFFFVGAPVLWCLMEWLRSCVLGGITWGHIGYTMSSIPALSGWASLGTVYSVSAVVITLNTLTTIVLKVRTTSACFWAAFAFTILCIGGYGLYPDTAGQADARTYMTQSMMRDTARESEISMFYNLFSASSTTFSDNIQLALFPENAFTFFIIDRQSRLPAGYFNHSGTIRPAFDALMAASREYPHTIVALGAHSTDSEGHFYNSLFFVQNGEIVARYDKVHLLPFGERAVPLLATALTPYSAGGGNQIIEVNGLRVRPYICSEVFYVDIQSAERSDLLLHAANESMFVSTLVATYADRALRMRSIEHGTPFLRATLTTGTDDSYRR